MENYIQNAIELLNQFVPYMRYYRAPANNDLTPYSLKRLIRRFNRVHGSNFQINNGLTRVVILGNNFVIKFDYNPEGIDDVGGCESEVKFYQFAEQKGFGYLFAPITPINVKGFTFYIMPRIHGIGRTQNNVEWELNKHDCAFVRAYLHDTHEYNYGWVNGYPVIIDYACNIFWDNCREKENYTCHSDSWS